MVNKLLFKDSALKNVFKNLWIVRLQIPEERSTFVANPALHPVFALAEFTGRHRSAALEALDHSGGVAVALLANGEVVEALLAPLALDAVKTLVALAGSLVVARNAD